MLIQESGSFLLAAGHLDPVDDPGRALPDREFPLSTTLDPHTHISHREGQAENRKSMRQESEVL